MVFPLFCIWDCRDHDCMLCVNIHSFWYDDDDYGIIHLISHVFHQKKEGILYLLLLAYECLN